MKILKFSLYTTKETLLSQLIREIYPSFSMPCAGEGRCGKCKVSVKGQVSPVSETERRFLSDRELSAGIRLACLTYGVGALTVEIDAPGDIVLTETLPKKRTLPKNSFHGRAVAVDLGTTTIAAQAVDLTSGQLLPSFACANPQRSFGADVISRIRSASDGNAGVLQEQVLSVFREILRQYAPVSQWMVTGNTAMLHLLTGKSIDGLLAYPFTPKSLFGCEDTLLNIPVYYPPCLSAFVGADAVCGLLSFTPDVKDSQLLCDIGTNGELILSYKGNIFAASAAAGPALEGAEISRGMAAAHGAINHVYLDGWRIRYTVIGGGEATGICGSGLIDALALFHRLGILDDTGKICTSGHRYPNLITAENGQAAIQLGRSSLLLTQEDIRKLQLAKAAFGAGIRILLAEAGLDCVETLYISGGFGTYLDIQNAMEIGLIPRGIAKKILSSGNTALSGALELLNQDTRRSLAEQLKNIKIIELSLRDDFNEQYLKEMNLG